MSSWDERDHTSVKWPYEIVFWNSKTVLSYCQISCSLFPVTKLMPSALCPKKNSALWSVPCALCPVPCALCPVPCALCPVPCALCPVSRAPCPVRSALCPVPCALCPVSCVLCPVPCAMCPVPCALSPVLCALYPVRCTLCPLPSAKVPFYLFPVRWRVQQYDSTTILLYNHWNTFPVLIEYLNKSKFNLSTNIPWMNSQICSNISHLQTQIWIVIGRLFICLVYCDKKLKKTKCYEKPLSIPSHDGVASRFGNLEKISLNFSSSSFVLRADLLHPWSGEKRDTKTLNLSCNTVSLQAKTSAVAWKNAVRWLVDLLEHEQICCVTSYEFY